MASISSGTASIRDAMAPYRWPEGSPLDRRLRRRARDQLGAAAAISGRGRGDDARGWRRDAKQSAKSTKTKLKRDMGSARERAGAPPGSGCTRSQTGRRSRTRSRTSRTTSTTTVGSASATRSTTGSARAAATSGRAGPPPRRRTMPRSPRRKWSSFAQRPLGDDRNPVLARRRERVEAPGLGPVRCSEEGSR